MTSKAYHHNKKTDVTYVYSVQSYWDKAKKAPRNKQVCIGKLDKDTGEIIPSKRKPKAEDQSEGAVGSTASVQVVGPCLLLEKLAELVGIADLLRRCFPGLHAEMLSLVYFIVQKGLPLSRSEAWSTSHRHPAGTSLSSQRISEILLKITEADRQKFLSLWLQKMTENDFLCYDITSISSYGSNEYLKYGYNRDGEELRQVNLAMLFGQKSRLPAYYRRMQGNISDVATLKTTMKSLDFLGAKRMNFILDRGFYSESNVDEMLDRHYDFTMAVPTGRKWVESMIDRHYELMASPAHYHQINDTESLFAVTEPYKWGERKRPIYLHIYYNAQQAAEEFDRFTRELLQYKTELMSGHLVKAHEENYARFFIVKETPKRGRKVWFNDAEIQKYRKRYAGFFCILSKTVKEPMDALRIYRAKEAVENSFDDLKNQLDMKRLRIHTSTAMDSRLFLQFLALILICKIRNTTQADPKLKNLTVREVMENLETLVEITFVGRRSRLYNEIGPLQRDIVTAFGLVIPS